MILPIGEAKPNRAFTLVEILLVVIIAGIVLALSAPNFSKQYSRFQLNKTAEDLLNVSRWAQAMAIGQQRVYALTFSGDRRSYGLVREQVDEQSDEQKHFEPVKGALGHMHMVPQAIRLDSHEDRIEFFPDGTIDPVTVHLASVDQKVTLSSKEVRGMLTKVDSD